MVLVNGFLVSIKINIINVAIIYNVSAVQESKVPLYHMDRMFWVIICLYTYLI